MSVRVADGQHLETSKEDVSSGAIPLDVGTRPSLWQGQSDLKAILIERMGKGQRGSEEKEKRWKREREE